MPAKKPAKGKAPAVEFSNPPAEETSTPQKRAPKVAGNTKKLPKPSWMSSEDEAALDAKFGSKKSAVEPEKQTVLPSEDWEVFTPKAGSEEAYSTSTPKTPTINYTPGDLGRKYGAQNVRPSTEKINPDAGRRNWASRTHQEMYGPAGSVQSQEVSFAPRQVGSSISFGEDENKKPFVLPGEPVMGKELYAIPGRTITSPYNTPEQDRNRAHLIRQQLRASGGQSSAPRPDFVQGPSELDNLNLAPTMVAGKRTLVDTSLSDDEVAKKIDNTIPTPLKREEYHRLYPASTNGDPHLIYSDSRNATRPSPMESTLLGQVPGRGIDRTATYSESSNPEERYQQYLAVKKSMYKPPVEPGNKGMYTPPKLIIPHSITSSGHRVLKASPLLRADLSYHPGGTSIPEDFAGKAAVEDARIDAAMYERATAPLARRLGASTDPTGQDFTGGEVKIDLNAQKGQKVVSDNSLPRGHEHQTFDDGSVDITPVKRSGLVDTSETRTFSPNEADITADEYSPATTSTKSSTGLRTGSALVHNIGGVEVIAHNKRTVHYRRVNNNGVPGIVKVGVEEHPGTFYQHPTTGQTQQTFDSPSAMSDDRSAIQKHGSALYDLYGPKRSNFSASTQEKINWSQSKLPTVINSVRNGDTEGTMAELNKNPDSIHDMFNEHFRVVPQKLAAYKKLVKEGTIAPVNIPKKIDFNKSTSGPTKAFSKITGNFEPISQKNAKERKVLDEQAQNKPVEEE